MKTPTFKPSGKFLERLDVPCLIAKTKNSKLAGVAGRYIAEFKEDPTCAIYLRGKNPKVISPWQRETLEKFFEKEELAPTIANVMKKYEASAGKEAYTLCDAKERNDFKKHGIVPFMTVSTIVIDDVRKEIIIEAGCDPAPHFEEHGLNIYLKKGSWHYDEGEYLSRYMSEFGPTAEEREDQLKMEKSRKKWDALYPPTPPGTPIQKDLSYVYGRWEVDKAATMELRKKLGSDPKWGNLDQHCVISEKMVESNLSQGIVVRAERHGNWCTIDAKAPYTFTLDFWSDGETLVDRFGLVFRRRDPWGDLFPLPSDAAIQTDPGAVSGNWEFDERKSEEVLRKLGCWNEKAQSEIKAQINLSPLGYRFSSGMRETVVRGEPALLEPPHEILGWERRGNRVTIQNREVDGKAIRFDEFWCDGEYLVERSGFAYRRIENWPSKASSTPSDEPPSYAALLPGLMTQMMHGRSLGKENDASLADAMNELGSILDQSMKPKKRRRK